MSNPQIMPDQNAQYGATGSQTWSEWYQEHKVAVIIAVVVIVLVIVGIVWWYSQKDVNIHVTGGGSDAVTTPDLGSDGHSKNNINITRIKTPY